ncbi:MAG: DUF423 domain-containing protein [Gemmatimonadota bacterium]|nr:DUF423 domain-containing protein [Gemmatimonadota bacterium]
MSILARALAASGAALALLAVALGAFGAHALRARLEPRDLEIFETAVRYQMYHALGLIGIAWLSTRLAGPLTGWAGWLMVAGTLVFSGSLYLLVLTGPRWLGAITPIGGVMLIAGWLLVLVAILRSSP